MRPIDKIDPGLIQFASVRQLEFIDAIEKHGSIAKATEALGVAKSTIGESMRQLRLKAARQHYAPEYSFNHPLPETHISKGVSQFVSHDGKVSTWYKSSLKHEELLKAVQLAANAFVADLPPLTAPMPPREFSTDIIPWIQIGDAHLGMFADAAEVGEQFDMEIAAAELLTAIRLAVSEMPACERCVVNNLGDFGHADNFSGTTAHSGHQLDMAGRIHRVIELQSRVLRAIIETCLTKAQHVDVICNQGNHDRVSAFWLKSTVDAVYGHTGRVHALPNSNPFIAYRMGNTLVMTNHGDKCPPARLVGVMMSDFRKDFGETEHHLIDVGHIHHRMVAKEHPEVVIESWNTLAHNDLHGHSGGWRSRQSLTVVLRSRTYGDVGRRVLPIQEIRDRMMRSVPRVRQKSLVTV